MFMTGLNRDINEIDCNIKYGNQNNEVNLDCNSCRKRLKRVTSMNNKNFLQKSICTDNKKRYCWCTIDNHVEYNFFNQHNEKLTMRLINSTANDVVAVKSECSDILVNQDKSTCLNKKIVIGMIIILGLTVAIIIAVICRSENKKLDNDEDDVNAIPDPEVSPPMPKWNILKTFNGGGAVAADVLACTKIGTSILKKNGSAVDAAIATALCSGLGMMHNMGLGGGFVMTIYERSTGKAYYLNARDSAPDAAYSNMFANKEKHSSRKGGLAITVPGEIAGYWEAHKRFGKLPWSELFIDTIKICDEGWNMSQAISDDLPNSKHLIYGDPILRSMFVNSTTNKFKPPNSLIKPEKLCDTLRILSKSNGPHDFYHGELGRMLVDDLKKHGSIITMNDLKSYKAKWENPLQSDFNDGSKLYTSGLPGSGPLLIFINNILDQYNFTSESLNETNRVITYHRMIETFKYAFAYRSKLGDSDYVNMTNLMKNLTSKEFARQTKEKISDERTWNDPAHYNADDELHEDHGTAHISVIAPNGDAVSLTSSINIFFGCGIVSESTGILLNSGMDDFSIPSVINYFGLPGNDKNNFIQSGKRPMSSMVPSIVVGPDGNVKMAIGAAGGTKITTATAYVIARYMWMNNNIKEAIDAPRIHHQLFPMRVEYQYGILKSVIDGLKKLGHKTYRYKGRGSVVVGLVQNNGTISGAGDFRRFGDVDGID